MEFFDTSKSIVENLYLLSGPILTLLAIAGVIQLFITRKTLIINSKRDAANLAAQQIKDYSVRIIPKMTKYDFSLIKEKIEKTKIEIGDFNVEYLNQKLGAKKVSEVRNERLKFLVLWLDVLNSMEAFATYFTKGVADEEIAFSSIGRTYCYSVENYFFEIADCRNLKDDNSFQNIIDLYKIWKERLKKIQLTKEQEELMLKLHQVNETKIDPIGTK
ncbi:hypothetical protein JS578_12475 [Dysgonomonadaceae bacterium zrk40]|nr:hypothetical protein JS578_12475 [Dysgonomonadaceae bacterium zrk40]